MELREAKTIGLGFFFIASGLFCFGYIFEAPTILGTLFLAIFDVMLFYFGIICLRNRTTS